MRGVAVAGPICEQAVCGAAVGLDVPVGAATGRAGGGRLSTVKG